jgi:protein-tyrosine phosphatase
MTKALFREVALPDEVPGRIYLHGMPGRYEALEETWASIGSKAIDRIVCLAPRDEIRRKSPEYASAIETGTVPCPVLEFAVQDFGAPDDDLEFQEVVKAVASSLRSGDRVLVHCGAGIGRTGMLAIAVLIVLGVPLDHATERVRDAGSSPERDAQYDVLRKLEDRRGA